MKRIALQFLALCVVLVVCVLFTTGCAGFGQDVIGTGQQAVDAAAARYGVTPYVASARELLAEAEAQKIGRTLLPADANAYPRQFIDNDGAALTNGVIEIQTFQVRRTLVAAPPRQPVINIPPQETPPPPVPALPAAGVTNGVDPDVLADIAAEEAKRAASND